jgi:hypothetical protein
MTHMTQASFAEQLQTTLRRLLWFSGSIGGGSRRSFVRTSRYWKYTENEGGGMVSDEAKGQGGGLTTTIPVD